MITVTVRQIPAISAIELIRQPGSRSQSREPKKTEIRAAFEFLRDGREFRYDRATKTGRSRSPRRRSTGADVCAHVNDVNSTAPRTKVLPSTDCNCILGDAGRARPRKQPAASAGRAAPHRAAPHTTVPGECFDESGFARCQKLREF